MVFSLDLLEQLTCPACERVFSTPQGRNSHLKTATSCSWYRCGKLKALSADEEEGGRIHFLQNTGQENEGEGEGEQDAFEYGDFFHFVPADPYPENVPVAPTAGASEDHTVPDFVQGSSRSSTRWAPRILDEDEDGRVVDEWTESGSVLRMDPTLHERWKAIFQSPSTTQSDADGDVQMDSDPGTPQVNSPNTTFHPFASELDWRVANWFIHEGIGHGSWDRFLQIPGVSPLTLPRRVF